VLVPSAVDGILRAWRSGTLDWSRAWLVVSLNGWLRDLRRSGVDFAFAPEPAAPAGHLPEPSSTRGNP